MSTRGGGSAAGSMDRQQLIGLLQGLLHEVANAATVVEGASCALEDPVSSDMRGELAEDLHCTYMDLSRLIERTRAAAGLLALAHGPQPLQALVHAASDMARLQRPAVVEGNHEQTVWGDKEGLTLLLAELLRNAEDAAPGGKLRVVARPEADTQQLELAVIDDGPGMADEVAARAREPFFGTRGRRGGGLGLTVAQGVAAQHDGQLAISTGQDGTEVVAILPLPSGLAADADQGAASDE